MKATAILDEYWHISPQKSYIWYWMNLPILCIHDSNFGVLRKIEIYRKTFFSHVFVFIKSKSYKTTNEKKKVKNIH